MNVFTHVRRVLCIGALAVLGSCHSPWIGPPQPPVDPPVEPPVDPPVPTLAAPQIEASGSFAKTVAITCATADAQIYYTTDGSAPTTASALYGGPFFLLAGQGVSGTVSAISVSGDGALVSDVVSLKVTCSVSPLNLAGEVGTLAGTGSRGAVNGTGTAASFYSPHQVTTDGTSLFIADTFNHMIRRLVISTGEVTTFAGSLLAGYKDAVGTDALFNDIYGITTDGTCLYVSDTENQRIRKIVIATGEVTTLAGSYQGYQDAVGTSARFFQPRGLACDGTSLYVADCYNYRVRRVRISDGDVTTVAGGVYGYLDAIGTEARFQAPNCIVTDGTWLYVGDSTNHRVRRVSIQTAEVTTIGAAVGYPVGMVVDGVFLYVADYGSHLITKIDLEDGETTVLAGSGTAGSANGTGAAASFNAPYGLTTDGSALYVAEHEGNTIRVIR